MEEKKRRLAGIWYTLSGGICWGLSGCFGQYLFQEKGVTAEWLVCLRLLLAGILLILTGLFAQGKELGKIWKNKKDRKQLWIFALFGMLVCQYTYFAAIQYSNAGTATVLQSMAPILILALVCVKSKRKPKGLEIGAVLCALLGVFLLSTHGNIHSMALTGRALFFGLGAAVGAAAYNVLSGDLLRRYGIYAIVGFAMLIAGGAMAVFVRPWSYAVPWDMGMLLAVAGVVIIGTAVAFLFI